MSATNLLSALLELDRQTEGRRVDMKYLLVILDRVLEVILRELRVGELVQVSHHTYEVEMRETTDGLRVKVLTIDNGVLGSRHRQGLVYASLEDNENFARQLPTVMGFYADHVREHRARIEEGTHNALRLLLADDIDTVGNMKD